jgi:hypothetical protein
MALATAEFLVRVLPEAAAAAPPAWGPPAAAGSSALDQPPALVAAVAAAGGVAADPTVYEPAYSKQNPTPGARQSLRTVAGRPEDEGPVGGSQPYVPACKGATGWGQAPLPPPKLGAVRVPPPFVACSIWSIDVLAATRVPAAWPRALGCCAFMYHQRHGHTSATA